MPDGAMEESSNGLDKLKEAIVRVNKWPFNWGLQASPSNLCHIYGTPPSWGIPRLSQPATILCNVRNDPETFKT